ncbi:ParA family protein [Hydrogenimonas urashimensis]|uniref:ParA family protein n=1 Tax=Hydrogenimonas urashimensis TaxID=2740515 RepID=UPI00191513D4|nr:ParA family protein [Hydrogenimonas urashimensis]
MEILKLGETAKKMHVGPERAREILEKRVVPGIKKSSSTRETYYVPRIMFDYAKTMLGLEKDKEFKKLETDDGISGRFANRNGPRVISFSNLKGGVGKTSIAANFAYNLALLNKRVLLVDMDSQANSSRYFANRYFVGESIKNLFDRMSRREHVGYEEIKEKIVPIAFDNATIDLLPSELSLGRIVELSRSVFTLPHKKLSDILKLVKEDYDFIVIDTPPSTGLSLHMSLYASDLVSIVTDAEDFSVNGLNELYLEIKELAEETDHDVKVDSVFINKVKKSNIHSVYIEAIAEMAVNEGIENLYTIKESTRFKESQNLHIPLIEYKKELEKKLMIAESMLEYAIEKAVEA